MDDLSRYRGLDHKVMSRPQLDALLRFMCSARDKGDSATFRWLRDRVVASTLRFALMIAKRSKGLPLEDRMQYAALGLIRACETFDISRGISFTTYSEHWIRHEIHRATDDTESTVRIPVFLRANIRKVARAAAKYRHAHGEIATVETLAAITGLTPAIVAKAMETNTAPPRSLDAPVSRDDDEEGATLGNRIADEADGPEEVLLAKERAALATELASKLDKRKHEIVARRFGLNGFQGDTFGLAEIGAGLGYSRERVRQLETEALDEMARAARRA